MMRNKLFYIHTHTHNSFKSRKKYTINYNILFFFLFYRMCREAIQLQPPPPASVEVRSAYKKYNSSDIVLRGVSLTVRRNTMYDA